MRKLYEFFKVLPFQKRIVAAATIWGNMVYECRGNYTWGNTVYENHQNVNWDSIRLLIFNYEILNNSIKWTVDQTNVTILWLIV